MNNQQNCPKCGAPMKVSRKGSLYCSALCWKNEQQINQEFQQTAQTIQQNIPQPVNDEAKWNKIARGKVKHAFALEAYKNKEPLSEELKQEINRWVDYVME